MTGPFFGLGADLNGFKRKKKVDWKGLRVEIKQFVIYLVIALVIIFFGFLL